MLEELEIGDLSFQVVEKFAHDRVCTKIFLDK